MSCNNYCSSFTYKENVCQSSCTEQKRQITEVHISLQICGSSLWNLLHVTLVAPKIWRGLLDFRIIYGPLTYTSVNWSFISNLQ